MGVSSTNAEGTRTVTGKSTIPAYETLTGTLTTSTEAHFATYPQKLVERMLKAGCSENGIVLDPFFGSGTTGICARKLNRNFIGIELNPEYIKIAENRLYKELGMFS